MLFLDTWFWGFVALAVPGYWLCPRRAKLVWLAAASAVFHWHFAGPAGVAVIAGLGALTYALGLAPRRGEAGGRAAFAAGLVVVLGALVLFKYAGLLVATAGDALAALGLRDAASPLELAAPAAPLAISFFAFLFIHYLYEVQINAWDPVRNPLHFALFAIYFPTLAAGPLKRFGEFVPQLDELRTPPRSEVWAGAQRVVLGLFKKVCIADLLVEPIGVLEQSPRWTAPLVLLIAVLQGWRVYYDFAGYTDVALGLSRMLGLRVPENFHRPFGATSLGEFWRRWHMSLSFWIRDYVFVPLGGSFVLSMALCGIWHGAAWNFLLWGLLHGVGLALESRARRRFPALFRRGWRETALRRAVFLAFITYSWLFFFYPADRVWEMTAGALRWLVGMG